MARKKKKKPAADASAEAGESGETPDAETVEPSASGTLDVVTRTLAPIHARHAHLHPSEVHLSLEPDGIGSADPAGSRAGSSADATPTRARPPEPASVEDVALELRTPEGDGETTTTARGGVGDPSDDVSADARSDDSDAPRDEHADDADDEDHGEDRVDRARRRTRRPPFAEITEEGVSEDARDTMRANPPTAAESPSRTPRSSDASGAFAAAIRSPAAFLKGLSFSARGDARGKGRSVETYSRDDEKTSDELPGAAGEKRRGFAKREKRRDKRRAKKARRRLKRLVHAANTMGSAVSAKEQTTTQLALCMQLGLTMCLKNQPSASSFAAVADAALAETDVAKTLEVKASNVEDGSKLPSFRFVTHAPCRFERVRSAWGLSLRNYAESFALETTTRKTGERERRRERNPTTSAYSPARHAREFSAGSSEGAGAFSLTDEGERSEGDGFFDGVSDDDEPRAETSATPRAESDDPRGAFKNRDGDAVFQTEDAAFSGNVSAAELVSTDAEDTRINEPDTHKRAGAGAVALRPDVFLPSQTSLRAISSAAASGKSSSWFFCSKDSRFLVKTCSLKERDVLLDILGEYSKHAETHRGTSLLPQYYGLYTIEVGSRSAHFIIMNYWFATMHAISKRFDLKGSTKGRRASRKERAKGDAAVLKDLDFLESDVHVQNRMAEEVKAAIATDVAFMERNRLIDYSMMVGLHFRDDAETRGNRDFCRLNTAAGSDGAGATSAEENGAPPSPGHRRRRSGYGSFGGSSGGNTERGALAHFSDASPPPTPSGTSHSRDARFSINSRDRENERDENDENDDDAIREPGTFTDAAAEDQNALVFAGPFAEPAADDTRLQFQLRALETPFGLAYLGIIDILTQYGAAKIAENLCFGALACGADISCQPPDVYARRFKRFIDAHVLKVAPTIDASAIDTASATLETDAAGDDGTNERV